MSYQPPRVMTAIRQRSSDGGEFTFVIDVDPADVMAEWDRIGVERGIHGLMLLRDRRSDEPGQDHGVHWQVWTSSVVGWDATDSTPPMPLP
jgi:hypothetical protein